MTDSGMATDDPNQVMTRSMVGKGVSLNTASMSQLTTVALISEEDANKIMQLRGENGELNLETLLAETSIDVTKLKQLREKGILHAVFEDEEGAADGEEEIVEERQGEAGLDMRDLVTTVAIQLEQVNHRLGEVEFGIQENSRGLKQTSDGLNELYQRQCAWEERQKKAQQEQGRAIDNILARLGWLEYKDKKKEDMAGRSRVVDAETGVKWSAGQQSKDVGGRQKENVEMRTSTPRQVLAGGSSGMTGEPSAPMQPGRQKLLRVGDIGFLQFGPALATGNLRGEPRPGAKGVHFSQEETRKTVGGREYQEDAAPEDWLNSYGYQARPPLSERGDFMFQDERGGIPYGSDVAMAPAEAVTYEDSKKVYHPGARKSKGPKPGRLPEESRASGYSLRRPDVSSRSLGERSSLLYNSRLSTSEESSDDDDEVETLCLRHRKPPQPKLPMFDGKSSEWGPFLFQFRKMAKIGRWTEKEKRDSLLACLRGKAITYIQTKHKYQRSIYESLKCLLEQRYGMTELPATARRQLSSMKQEEGETLEDFADRVMGKTGEGYLGVSEDTLQVLATEAFLRGCRDKNAAYAASERRPETLCKAVEEMRDVAANIKAFNRGSLMARQVTFVDSEDEQRSSRDGRKSRRDQDSNILSAEQMALVKYMTEVFAKNFGGSAGVSRSTSPTASTNRTRSPSPGRNECFKCGKTGHYARECKQASECFTCGKTGHFAADCPKNRSSSPSSYKGSGSQKTFSRSHAETEEKGSDLNSSGEGSSA